MSNLVKLAKQFEKSAKCYIGAYRILKKAQGQHPLTEDEMRQALGLYLGDNIVTQEDLERAMRAQRIWFENKFAEPTVRNNQIRVFIENSMSPEEKGAQMAENFVRGFTALFESLDAIGKPGGPENFGQWFFGLKPQKAPYTDAYRERMIEEESGTHPKHISPIPKGQRFEDTMAPKETAQTTTPQINPRQTPRQISQQAYKIDGLFGELISSYRLLTDATVNIFSRYPMASATYAWLKMLPPIGNEIAPLLNIFRQSVGLATYPTSKWEEIISLEKVLQSKPMTKEIAPVTSKTLSPYFDKVLMTFGALLNSLPTNLRAGIASLQGRLLAISNQYKADKAAP